MDKPELTPPTLPDEKRRHLVRGGLAAPIVLGTLASKQALGGGASYGCSVSGKWSGGSTHGTAPSCKTGKSCVEVQTACKGSGHPAIKGDCTKRYQDKVYWDPNNHEKFDYCGVTVHTLLGYSHNCFYRNKRDDGSWEMNRRVSWDRDKCKRMSAYEVLFLDRSCTSDSSLIKHAELGREAVCAYYNAQNFQPSGYPCNTTQVVGMTNDCLLYGKVYLSKYFAVADKSSYWTTDEVISFFKECRHSDRYT